jgi:predicted nuclease with RNAse H fold
MGHNTSLSYKELFHKFHRNSIISEHIIKSFSQNKVAMIDKSLNLARRLSARNEVDLLRKYRTKVVNTSTFCMHSYV